MNATIRRVRDIKQSTDSQGNIHRGRSALLDYEDGMTAEWKYVNDELMKPEDIKPGMKVNFLCDSKGWITVLDKIS